MLYHCIHQLQRIQQLLVVGGSLGVFHDKLPASKQCLMSLRIRSCLIEILLFNRCVCHLVHTVGQDKAPGVDSKYLCKHRPGTLLENT